MATLVLITFDWGLEGDRYQEVVNGEVTRWFDLDGTEITLPADCGYHCADASPAVPEWYSAP